MTQTHKQITIIVHFIVSSLLIVGSSLWIWCSKLFFCPSQYPRGLRRRSTAAHLLRSWVPFPLGACMFVCCECCVLSGRDICDGLITRPRESYRLWRVVLCDQETSYARRLKPARGLQNTKPQWVVAPVEKKIFFSFRNNEHIQSSSLQGQSLNAP